jgi:hypothetical protein
MAVTKAEELRETAQESSNQLLTPRSISLTSPGCNIDYDITSLQSALKVTAGSRDKLPPVCTYRGGLVARFELWIKRQLKRVTRWYIWEQVNFNSAVHHALTGTLATLEAHERRISEIRNGIDDKSISYAHEPFAPSLEARVGALEISLDELRRVNVQQQSNTQHDELRVCFKQLALQLSEVAITADRAQRRSQLRLDELASRIAAMEALQTEIEEMLRAIGSHHD